MRKNNQNSQKRHLQHDQKQSFDDIYPIDGDIHRDRSNCQQTTYYLL